MLLIIVFLSVSASKAIDILEAYEGTLEDDPPESERYEHSEMVLYKVCKLKAISVFYFIFFVASFDY